MYPENNDRSMGKVEKRDRLFLTKMELKFIQFLRKARKSRAIGLMGIEMVYGEITGLRFVRQDKEIEVDRSTN